MTRVDGRIVIDATGPIRVCSGHVSINVEEVWSPREGREQIQPTLAEQQLPQSTSQTQEQQLLPSRLTQAGPS